MVGTGHLRGPVFAVKANGLRLAVCQGLIQEVTVEGEAVRKFRVESCDEMSVVLDHHGFVAVSAQHLQTVTEAANDVVDGIRFVAGLLSNDLLWIDENCEHTKKEFTSYCWDAKAQKVGLDKPLKQNDHCMDMVRYGLFTHFFRAFKQQLFGFNFN